MTSRERVIKTLRFETPDRMPISIWTLPYAATHYPELLHEIQREFPDDTLGASSVYTPSARVKGDPYAQGTYTDEWGCLFENIQSGAIGEVRSQILGHLDEWQTRVTPPYETLPTGVMRQTGSMSCLHPIRKSDAARFGTICTISMTPKAGYLCNLS